jgi:hypothetical protein
MRRAWIPVVLGAVGALLATSVGASASTSNFPVVDDSGMTAQTTTTGGASPLATDRTVQHWFGQTLDPNNGVTYGYNMVGVDPATESAATVQVDVIPLIVNVGGVSFDGTSKVSAVLNSPQFATDDYSRTPAATASGGTVGPGGALSKGNTGVQLEDATMRAQFNKVGTGYHLYLNPTVEAPITVNVPAGQGVVVKNTRGIIEARVDYGWWGSEITNLFNSPSIDATHLPLFLTDNVVLYLNNNYLACCVIGFHGATRSSTNGNGVVQTFAWASWLQPGFYNTAYNRWTLQDINALTHEISEWSDDPFITNTVQPWATPTAPQYGCSGLLETGDPVVNIGFAKGTNTTDQNQYSDGYYHPEDEVFLPWFMRQNPNTTSQAIQGGSTGRYTLMGSLNPYPGFQVPASGC